MRRIGHLVIIGVAVSIALATIPLRSARADESSGSKPDSSGDPPSAKAKKGSEYRRLLDELDAERKRVDELEREVKMIEGSNAKLEQTTSNLQTSNQQLATQLSQTQNQMGGFQKIVATQLGPQGFGDRINSFLGSHTFTLAGTVSTGYYYSRQGNHNSPTLDFELYPLLRFNDWLQFYGNLTVGLSPGFGGEAAVFAGVANLQIFPFGQEAPFELVAGIFDKPFNDYWEDQPINFVSPFVTTPLPYGPEAFVPPSSVGLQARGGYQWGQPGQDWDYTTWIDSGPTFESAVGTLPAPVIGEGVNPLTGVNLSTKGIAVGGRLRFYPLPVDWDWGRAELYASTYDGKWMDGLWYESWGVGASYRVGPFRTRAEWLQSYRQMGSGPTGMPDYPGCCGHDNRQGWFAQVGYFLYGIPHPYLGDWLEPRFNKLEFSVRYSGVNQRAIVTNDITTSPVFGFSGSPSVFYPHAREVAFGLDYWISPKIVWKNEFDLELPRTGGTFYTFANGAGTPTASAVGSTTNDFSLETQLTVQF